MIDPLVRRPGRATPGRWRSGGGGPRGARRRPGRRRWLEEHPEIGRALGHEAVPTRVVFVAELASPTTPVLVVGYLVLDVAGEVARVDQVYVTPEARELGFGDALLEAATDAARCRRAPPCSRARPCPATARRRTSTSGPGITARLITVSRRLD